MNVCVAIIASLALAISLFNLWAISHLGSALRDALWREYARAKKEADAELAGIEQTAAVRHATIKHARRRFFEDADRAAKN